MSPDPSPARVGVALGSLALAALVAMASLGGILLPDAYAHESTDWRGQALGQDWFDLVIAAPWLVLCAVGTLRRRGHWHLLLAGALLFTLYTFLIYAFASHFNALFLVYCAALGLSFYLTIVLLHSLTLTGERPRATVRTPVRSTGILLCRPTSSPVSRCSAAAGPARCSRRSCSPSECRWRPPSPA